MGWKEELKKKKDALAKELNPKTRKEMIEKSANMVMMGSATPKFARYASKPSTLLRVSNKVRGKLGGSAMLIKRGGKVVDMVLKNILRNK